MTGYPHIDESSEHGIDVAIVGAGIGGLYAALRLVEDGGHDPSRIAVFDASRRLGGRLKTFHFEPAPAFGIDLGAMLYWPSAHRRLDALIARLQLPTCDFPLGAGRNPIRLRARTLLASEVRRYALYPLFPFRVSRSEQVKGSLRTFREVTRRIFKEAGLELPALHGTFDANHPWRGRPLRDWSLWEGLSQILNSEQLANLEARTAFSVYTRAPSLAHGLEMLIDLATTRNDSRTLCDGFEALAGRIAHILSVRGVRMLSSHRLTSIERAEARSRAMRLTLAIPGHRTLNIDVAAVILTLGRDALAALDRWPDGARPDGLLNAVEGWPFGKAVLLYERPWWTSFGITHGFGLTDHPLRQIWYFGAEPERLARGTTQGLGVVMPFFDGSSLEHWRQLAGDAPRHDGLVRVEAGHPLALALDAEIRSLHTRFDIAQVPAAMAAALQDWGTAPYGGAMHVFKRGVDHNAMRLTALDSIADANVYIAGEAFSRWQGWIEGALQTVDDILARHFRISTPSIA